MARALALAIVRGGEGATKLVAITVTGGESRDAAVRAAKTIANSPLVKTAVHGADPNWGRLVAAAGRSGARFVLDHAAVEVGGVTLFRDGQPHDDRAPQAAEHLKQSEIDIVVDLGTGGPGTRDRVDVRSQRRIRSDQRGVPDMSRPSAARVPARIRAVKSPRVDRTSMLPARSAIVRLAARRVARGRRAVPGSAAAAMKAARARPTAPPQAS